MHFFFNRIPNPRAEAICYRFFVENLFCFPSFYGMIRTALARCLWRFTIVAKRLNLKETQNPKPAHAAEASRLGWCEQLHKGFGKKKWFRVTENLRLCCLHILLWRCLTLIPYSLHNPTKINPVHLPACECPCGPVYDYQLKEFSNGTLHVYRFCRSCGERARSPVKRESIPLETWRALCSEHRAGRAGV